MEWAMTVYSLTIMHSSQSAIKYLLSQSPTHSEGLESIFIQARIGQYDEFPIMDSIGIGDIGRNGPMSHYISLYWGPKALSTVRVPQV